jgi:hypothetical protein
MHICLSHGSIGSIYHACFVEGGLSIHGAKLWLSSSENAIGKH